MPTHPLKLFKASAGSGKTFTLAVEYIKLLIQNPRNYRTILAVTFTNKATAEMKHRILSQLYGLAHPPTNGAKDESADYLREIQSDPVIRHMQLGEDEIRRRAGLSLQYMMHDYSRFRIETIDSFFQSVVRELAHELNLTANLRVDLNDNEVLSQAVKDIINELVDGSDVFRSVFDFVQERIDENKNWKIDQEVEQFGRNIFNEQYLQSGAAVHQKIGDPAFLRRYKQKLHSIRVAAENEAKSLGSEFISHCTAMGFACDDFKGKSRSIYAFFEKLANGQRPNITATVEKHLGDADCWADSAHPDVRAAATSTFIPLLDRTLTTLRSNEEILNSITVISQHLNHLMLINVINDKVRSLNADANRFLLADTAHFLHDIIDGSDIPFLYERTGSRFNHIMIDEFQDTSALQWENFKPLLFNSLSANNTCLIVGDVKQSIYRWRNSDWSILNNIEDGVFSNYIDPKTIHRLGTNYRSSERVIRFNNQLFTNATATLNSLYESKTGLQSEDITKAYTKVCQQVAPKNKGTGFVRIEFLKKQDGDEDDMELLQLEHIAAAIGDLQQGGVSLNDITILIRRNKHIPIISQYFSSHYPDIRIVSDEAFRLDFSPAIRLIILALRCIASPQDKYALTLLAHRYQTLVLENRQYEDDLNSIFLLDCEHLLSLLPPDFVAHRSELGLIPIYELAEQVYHQFQLEHIKQQDAYLFSFFDQLSAYLDDKPTDLGNFLNYWDEYLCGVTIPNGAIDGVRIMSIHKSKGLEFPSVIIPYCDWRIGSGSDLLWCKPKQAPFNEIPLSPVVYSSTAQASIFKADCESELLKNYVDNINLVYVALTRAKHNLIVIAGENGESSVYALLHQSMPTSLDNEDGSREPLTEAEDRQGNLTYSIGEIVPSQQKDDKKVSNPLLTQPKPVSLSFRYFDSSAQFLQSNQSERFINSEDPSEADEYIDEGNLFHALLQEIRLPDDLDRAVRTIDTQGYFRNTLHRDRVRRFLAKCLQEPRVATWFAPHWQVINECSIAYTDAKGIVRVRRPDRVITDGSQTVVIDYKTGRQDNRHADQVQLYIDLLRQMGYPHVSGYLWYIRRHDIVPVKDPSWPPREGRK